MDRPPLEVADIFRRYGNAYGQQADGSPSTAQRRVMTAQRRGMTRSWRASSAGTRAIASVRTSTVCWHGGARAERFLAGGAGSKR